MKCDAVFFDLDGTLWNATVALTESWRIALDNQADVKAAPTLEQMESVMGMTAEDLTETLFPYLGLERRLELFDICCEVENKYLRQHGGVLYEGMIELLEALGKHVPVAIISNCNRDYIDCFLEAHRLHRYFADWECIGRTGLQKWENIRLVAERNHVKRPVYVGDTVLDHTAAEKAGVPFIHAAYGFGKVPGVPKIEKPMELLELLDF